MYADDSTITCSSSNINEIENNLNTALGRICDWCVRNKLTINANKTKSMLIGSKQTFHNTDLNVSIAGILVIKLNYVKLGVRSLANASRARQFNPLNPPGVGWVPLPQTNMAAVVGRARSCAVVRAWSVMRGRAW